MDTAKFAVRALTTIDRSVALPHRSSTIDAGAPNPTYDWEAKDKTKVRVTDSSFTGC